MLSRVSHDGKVGWRNPPYGGAYFGRDAAYLLAAPDINLPGALVLRAGSNITLTPASGTAPLQANPETASTAPTGIVNPASGVRN